MTNYISSTVSVINTATNTVVATVPVGLGASAFGQFIGFSLSFPLKGLDPYKAPVVSVFDHSMSCLTKADPKCPADGAYRIYGCDEVVKVYTHEKPGNIDPDVIGCKNHPGYAQEGHAPFYVNGHYVGDHNDTRHLNYDGHPGIDYRAVFGTEVYAAAAGIVRYPKAIAGIQDADVFNVLELDPGNGYKIYYLHLSTHPRTISLHLTGDATSQDFIATPTGSSPSITSEAAFETSLPQVRAKFSISGRITHNGRGLSGVSVELRGYSEGCADVQPTTTDQQGNYRFTGLPAGDYHIRPVPQGYTFRPTRPNPIMVKEGKGVSAGDLIALTGNAGPCTPPHLHFEVQRKTSEKQKKRLGFKFIPVDPYGWDGDGPDPYKVLTDVSNVRLWAHRPVINSISPTSVPPMVFDLTITGDGFDSKVADCLIQQSNDYSNPVCLRGTVLSRSSTQLVVRESLPSGAYFVHVENGDGRRSNWKKLVVK